MTSITDPTAVRRLLDGEWGTFREGSGPGGRVLALICPLCAAWVPPEADESSPMSPRDAHASTHTALAEALLYLAQEVRNLQAKVSEFDGSSP